MRVIVNKISRLVNRNVTGLHGRTSMRLEPELWEAVEEFCRREGMTCADFVKQIDETHPDEPRTSAVRARLFTYFRAAATDEGHAKAGHGSMEVA